MTQPEYNMSFTAGGLFNREAVTLAERYLDLSDWDAVRKDVVSNNLLQARTQASLTRMCREVAFRLRVLSDAELSYFAAADPRERAYLLWLAACRRHGLLAEFASEVVRERYVSLQVDLNHEDFDAFFNRKAEWHRELESVRDSTRDKLRQVTFRMLREAELLDARNTIQPAQLSAELIALIARTDERELFYFPAFESDITVCA